MNTIQTTTNHFAIFQNIFTFLFPFLLCSFPDQSGTETEEVSVLETVGDRVETAGRTAGNRRIPPAAAAHHPFRAFGGTGRIGHRIGGYLSPLPVIPAPLPHIAVHVVEAPGIRLFQTDLLRAGISVL